MAVQLGNIKKKATTTSKSKEYPTLPDDTGEVEALVGSIIELTEKFDDVKGSLDLAKSEINALGRGIYFQYCNGKNEIPSTFNAEQNCEIQELIPMSVSIKTKGIK